MNVDPRDPIGTPPDYLRLFIDRTVEAWAEYDHARQYQFVNPTGAALIGWDVTELIGKTNTELGEQPDTSPRFKAIAASIDACVEEAITSGEPVTAVHEFATEVGIKFYEMTYTPILVEGAVARVFSVGREVTEYQHLISQLHAIGETDEAETPRPELPEPRPARKVDHQQAKMMRQSAELLQLVLDNIPQYIFWKDRNSVYLGCNRRWAEMAGVGDPENVVGLTDADLPWTEEQTAWYLECDRQVMDTDTPLLGIKESQLQADGKLTWREVNKLPIHDASGQVIGTLGTIEDVTDRKLAEDLLLQSEAKFRQLAKQEELLNQLFSQIRNSLDLNIILKTVVREVRQLLNADRVVIYEFQENWQGSVVVEDVLKPWQSVLGNIGNDNCFAAEYASLYQSGRVRVIDNVLEAGLEACHVRFLQRLQVQANLIVPIVNQTELWGLLIVHQCRDTRAWLDWEVSLLKQLATQVAIAIQQANLYAQTQASAEQAQLQAQQLQLALEELQQTQAQLIQTEKMSSLGQLIAGIAHEINNPVNFIYGNLIYINDYTQDLVRLVDVYQEHYPNPASAIQAELETVELEFLKEDLAKILNSVRVGAERIRQLVLSLRNFSRLDEAEMKSVNIHEGIDSTLLILQHRLKHKSDGTGITVIKQYGNLPPIECYAVQLNQVFMNIISNAIDALESYDLERSLEERQAKPSTIAIATQILPTNGRAMIRIKDNGAGMPESIRQRLFDPFFTTKPIGKGTGLGLAISHQIVVERHGGSLSCISEPGRGAEFWIEIPIHQEMPDASSEHDTDPMEDL